MTTQQPQSDVGLDLVRRHRTPTTLIGQTLGADIEAVMVCGSVFYCRRFRDATMMEALGPDQRLEDLFSRSLVLLLWKEDNWSEIPWRWSLPYQMWRVCRFTIDGARSYPRAEDLSLMQGCVDVVPMVDVADRIRSGIWTPLGRISDLIGRRSDSAELIDNILGHSEST